MVRDGITWAGLDIVVEILCAMGALGVVWLCSLVKGVAYPHPGTADQLLLHQARVERAPNLIGRVDLCDFHLARLVIDSQVHH